MMWRTDFNTKHGVNHVFEQVTGRPGWVGKASLLAAGLVVVVPLVLLALAGLIVGIVVFVTLGLIAQIIMSVGMLLDGLFKSPTGSDGRHNVRVIDREPPLH
jgi:uncharacterized BrkB/YihY/UPF0761 family membrane protein